MTSSSTWMASREMSRTSSIVPSLRSSLICHSTSARTRPRTLTARCASPGLDNHAMGTIFEELVRRFNEENNEEAGEHGLCPAVGRPCHPGRAPSSAGPPRGLTAVVCPLPLRGMFLPASAAAYNKGLRPGRRDDPGISAAPACGTTPWTDVGWASIPSRSHAAGRPPKPSDGPPMDHVRNVSRGHTELHVRNATRLYRRVTSDFCISFV
jgi:hypothetical protein